MVQQVIIQGGTVKIDSSGTATITGGTVRLVFAEPPRETNERSAGWMPEPAVMDPEDEDPVAKSIERDRASTRERVRRYRARHRTTGDADGNADVTPGNAECNADVTPVTPECNAGNADVTPETSACLSDWNINITNTSKQTSNPIPDGNAVTPVTPEERYTTAPERYPDAPPECRMGTLEQVRAVGVDSEPPGQLHLPWYEPRRPKLDRIPVTIAAHAVHGVSESPPGIESLEPAPDELIPFPTRFPVFEHPRLASAAIQTAWTRWRKWRVRRARNIRWECYQALWDELEDIHQAAGEPGVLRCLEWAIVEERLNTFACPRAVFLGETDEPDEPPSWPGQYLTEPPKPPDPEPEQPPEERRASLMRELEFCRRLGSRKLIQDTERRLEALERECA